MGELTGVIVLLFLWYISDKLNEIAETLILIERANG